MERGCRFLALVEGRPQVLRRRPRADHHSRITTAPQGVFAYEWSPDGETVAYVTRAGRGAGTGDSRARAAAGNQALW